MTMGQLQKDIRMNVTTGQDLWPYQVVDELQKVMEQGERDGKKGWEGVYSSTHIHHAVEHLRLYFVEGVSEDDHLTHAFTRLMMAVAIERGYMEPVVLDEEDADA